jgi:hypothetical protein
MQLVAPISGVKRWRFFDVGEGAFESVLSLLCPSPLSITCLVVASLLCQPYLCGVGLMQFSL